LYYHALVLCKKACQSIPDNNVLRILKNYKLPPGDVEKTSTVRPATKSPAPSEPPTAAQPSWQGMSARLLQRLSVADEAIPEMQMPASSEPAPSNRSTG